MLGPRTRRQIETGFHFQGIFKDADAMRKAMAQLKQQGKIDGQEIPKDQMEDLNKRLNKVCTILYINTQLVCLYAK